VDTLLNLLVWGGLFFVMMRFGCGSHIFGHGGHGKGDKASGAHAGGCCGPQEGHAHGKPEPDEARSNTAIPEKYVDPVCGEAISADRGKPSVHGGQVYYFCSRECREVFEAGPHYYLKDDGDLPSLPPLRLEHPPAGGRSHV